MEKRVLVCCSEDEGMDPPERGGDEGEKLEEGDAKLVGCDSERGRKDECD